MESLIRRIRRLAGLTQAELAARARTSRTAIAAYESGAKSPNLDTTERICEAAGCRLVAEFVEAPFEVRGTYRGRPIEVPLAWPRRDPATALRTAQLPLHLEWSSRREFDLRDRYDRMRVYSIVMQEGRASDVVEWLDPVLLADLWDELILPRAVRAAWEPVIHRWTSKCSDRSNVA